MYLFLSHFHETILSSLFFRGVALILGSCGGKLEPNFSYSYVNHVERQLLKVWLERCTSSVPQPQDIPQAGSILLVNTNRYCFKVIELTSC